MKVKHYDHFKDYIKGSQIQIKKMTFYTKMLSIYRVNIDYIVRVGDEFRMVTHKMKSNLEMPKNRLKKVEFFMRDDDRITEVGAVFGDKILTLKFSTEKHRSQRVNKIYKKVREKIDVNCVLEEYERIAFINAGFMSKKIFDSLLIPLIMSSFSILS